MKNWLSLISLVLLSACVSADKPEKKEVDLTSMKPRRLLKKNMKLLYSSNGKETPKWIVKSVGRKYKGKKACAKTKISYDSGKSFETKEECIEGLFLKEKTKKGWVKSRPVATFSTLEKKMKKGKTARAVFNTGEYEPYTVGGKRLMVLNTQMISYDRGGNIVGRLSEKYSVDLGTAVEGLFEIPTKEGWAPVNSFKLIRIQ